MEMTDVMLRAIGVLTQVTQWHQALNDDVDVEIATDGSLSQLVSEVLDTSITVAPDAHPEEVVAALSEALQPRVHQLLAAHAFLFSELAAVHDAGRTDISTAELLRHLALRMASPD